TVPIRGKLTSGTKRPYATSRAETGSTNDTYTPEIPGPDKMYGPSDPNYRDGFTPGGNYADFSDIPLYCTDQPTVFQTQSTKISMSIDPSVLDAQRKAQAALKANNPALAEQILENATKGGNK